MIKCQYKTPTKRVIVLSQEELLDSWAKRKTNKPPEQIHPHQSLNTQTPSKHRWYKNI